MRRIVLVVLLAPPGSGKGTLSEMLRERADFLVLSAGKIFRNLFSKKNESMPESDEKLEGVTKGKYLPDEVVNKYVIEELERLCSSLPNSGEIYISVDGYPRTLAQAERLKEWSKGKELIVVKLEGLDETELWRRLSNRYLCEKEEHIFNALIQLPKDLKCPRDGSKLIRREDDASVELLKKRLKQHEELTLPLWEYYAQQDVPTISLDSRENTEKLFEELKRRVGF